MYIYLWIHSGSAFLAMCGMLHIMMSFPLAFFLYRYLFGIMPFYILSFLAIYIILAIGADGDISLASTSAHSPLICLRCLSPRLDIFVFMDAWRQSAFQGPEVNKNLHTRMAYTFKRAAKVMIKPPANTHVTSCVFCFGVPISSNFIEALCGVLQAMLITSATTFGAFGTRLQFEPVIYDTSSLRKRPHHRLCHLKMAAAAGFAAATAVSPLGEVATFGLFTALLVVSNYIFVITYFPAAVLCYHRKYENTDGMCCFVKKRTIPRTPEFGDDPTAKPGCCFQAVPSALPAGPVLPMAPVDGVQMVLPAAEPVKPVLPAVEMMEVVVPPGEVPGAVIEHSVNGQLIKVAIPAGAEPGTRLSIEAPVLEVVAEGPKQRKMEVK